MIDSIEAVHSDPTEDLLDGANPGLSDAEREARKPDISRLPNALDNDGLPLFRVGEKIIIERRSLSLAGNPYLDTRTYTVISINYENGNLDLFDEVLAQSALSSYTRGPSRGFVFKLAKGNVVATKKKRGRPRKNPLGDESLPPPPPPTDEHGNPIKKRRGRPPGSKNK